MLSIRPADARGLAIFGWLQVVRGDVQLNSLTLQAGDGVAVEAPQLLNISALSDAEALLFDMAQ